MKKYILSGLLVVTFGTYAIYARMNGSAISLALNPGTNGSQNGLNNGTTQAPANLPQNSTTPKPAPAVTVPARTFWSDDEEDDDDRPRVPRNPVTTNPATVVTTPVVTVPTMMLSTTSGMGQGGMMNSGPYKNGVYNGDQLAVVDGDLQVSVTIMGGNITDITFPVSPINASGQSRSINNYALPILKQEAIQAQNANVNTVSGATYSSEVFKQSLGSALALAKK